MALLINDAGLIAGTTVDGRVFRQAGPNGPRQYLGGVVCDLPPTSQGNLTVAFVSGINSRGDIVGNAGPQEGGFVCSFVASASSNTLVGLSSPGAREPGLDSAGIDIYGVSITANAVNDDGVVVGNYRDFGYWARGACGNYPVHNMYAFKWTAGEGFVDLGNLGGLLSNAAAINRDGTIVGSTAYPRDPQECNKFSGFTGFVYDPTTQVMTPLPGLFPGGASPTGINDDGVVVGGDGFGTWHSLLWDTPSSTPVNITPTFAPYFAPGPPLIAGSTVAGTGNTRPDPSPRGWVLSLPNTPTDATPPVITPTVTGTLGNNGWYTSNVSVSWTVTDAESAVSSKTGCDPTTVTTDTTGVTFTCTATSSGGTNSISVTVKRDATAPVISNAVDTTAEATGPAGASVSYLLPATDNMSGPVNATCSPTSGSTFSIGTTTVTCTATDQAGNSSSASFKVTVKDSTAPTFTSGPTPSPAMLWPPNHRMVPVTVDAQAFDAVGATVRIVSVTSSEPDNGLGDGDTANDIQVTGALTVNLRAERSGKGNGRTYTITVEAKDAAGNATLATTTVTVPKSQSGK